MLTQFPIKKEYLFTAAAILLFLACYQLAFKRTLAAWQINRQLKAQIERSGDLSYQPAYLKRKNNNLAQILSRYKTDTTAFRSNIISRISAIAEEEHVKLTEVPLQNPLYRTDQFTIQKLGFEGGFFALANALNRLHAQKQVGMVRSANFKIIEIRSGSSSGRKMMLEVYLETVN